jgi:hypothetical protein
MSSLEKTQFSRPFSFNYENKKNNPAPKKVCYFPFVEHVPTKLDHQQKQVRHYHKARD